MALTRKELYNARVPGLGDVLETQELQTGWHNESDADRAVWIAYLESPHPLPDGVFPAYPKSIGSVDTAVAYLNEVKAQFTAHMADDTVHVAADVTNAVSAADATNQATAITLANELKTDLNGHFADAGHRGSETDTVNSVDSAAATDFDTLMTLTQEIVEDFRFHLYVGALRTAEQMGAPDTESFPVRP